MVEKKKTLLRLLALADIFVVAISFLLAFLLRQNIHFFYKLDIYPDRHLMNQLSFYDYLNILPIVLFIWWIAFVSSGFYNSFRVKPFFEIFWTIIKSAFFAIVVFTMVVFIFKLSFVSRLFVVLFFLVSCLFLTIERVLIMLFLRYIRKRGLNYKNVLLVGTSSRAGNFIGLIERHPEWGLRIVGLIDLEKSRLGKTICSKKVIGLLADIPKIIRKMVIHEVVFIVPRNRLSSIEETLLICETEGINTRLAADFFNLRIARFALQDLEGIPMLNFKTTIGEEWQLLLKRLFDIMMSSLSIIVLLPVFLPLFVVIKFFYGDPVIFKQARSGLNGREFTMYKFRTMVNGAEDKLKTLYSFNEMDGAAFKMSNDPRVTKFGNFLRRTSLDELPQLFNILEGNMSLVGPRPLPSLQTGKFKSWQRRRLSVKPGLTCICQANGRNNVDFNRWMEMDLEYIDNWSLALDLKILLKTIPAVLFSVGAR